MKLKLYSGNYFASTV